MYISCALSHVATYKSPSVLISYLTVHTVTRNKITEIILNQVLPLDDLFYLEPSK